MGDWVFQLSALLRARIKFFGKKARRPGRDTSFA